MAGGKRVLEHGAELEHGRVDVYARMGGVGA